jgi:integrase
MPTAKLTKRIVDGAQSTDRDLFFWDSEVAGFGLKVTPGGRKVYVCQYRVGGGRRGVSRRYSIGVHGAPWTVEKARKEARRLLGLVANGSDPVADVRHKRATPTVSELCELYLSEGCSTKKESTLATDRGRIERHIKPLLGRKPVSEVTRADVRRFLNDVAKGKTRADIKTGRRGRAIVEGGQGTATRTVGLLGGIFSFAQGSGLREDNPVRGVKRFPDRKSERFLSSVELAKLGRALTGLEGAGSNPSAIAIIRLLALTGARKGEISNLRWSEVDFERAFLRLGDSKTGQKIVPVGAPALQLLASLPRDSNSQFVFPAAFGGGRFQGVDKVWRKIRVQADLSALRLHDLRHSYASMGIATGDALPIIGALLGHADVKTTARYAHLADDPVKAAADRISGAMANALMGIRSGGRVVTARRRQ